jgi:hypothetical protein
MSGSGKLMEKEDIEWIFVFEIVGLVVFQG